MGKPGEPGAARIPWSEAQAEPSAAGRCTSTSGRKRRSSTADAPEQGCGSTGIAPGDTAPLWEQRPGPSRLSRGETVRHAGLESQLEFYARGTRAVAEQGGGPWCDEACVLDFDEDCVEEGELVEGREEEDWWAQGGAGPAIALSQSFQRARPVQPACGKALDGSRMGRRKAEERPPSLTAGEESASVRRVSVAVEATEELGNGAARLLKGVYVSDKLRSSGTIVDEEEDAYGMRN
ncbi:hypothetical protein NDU88_004745 [Pleurodeles waltl]|uniref:Uncharacterized protein n=1 Tax=Pleurodeles waltl TaxID=8319 RepID=A0AAV7TTB4_PLEWA|nr:hypothetical protein NDU88_004745 [Pleurodeles waltl]